MKNPESYIAHVRKSDAAIQNVSEHLLEAAEFAGKYAGKIGFEEEGRFMGLLHDFGKYSRVFQDYIRSPGLNSSGADFPDQERENLKVQENFVLKSFP